MEMVEYWKNSNAIPAKVMEVDNVTVMQMEGEKYQFPGFPRGYLLFGRLSKLKHEVKSQVFNDSWALLEEGKPMMPHIRSVMPNIEELLEASRFDMVPHKRMAPPVAELYRAWTKVSPETSQLRDLVTYVFQEDDAYRFRFQWMTSYFGWFGTPAEKLDRGLQWLEQAEIIGDMRERVRLVRRVLLEIIDHDPTLWNALYKEIDWKKVKMSKADKFFFRAKYFKVDLDWFEY